MMKSLATLVVLVCSIQLISSLPLEDDPVVGDGWGGPNSIELVDANITVVENKDQNWMWIVYRPACGNCKGTQPQWIQAADTLKGSNVKLGHIDCDKNSKYWKYQKTGGSLPFILFMSKTDKSGDNKYKGQRTAANLVEWAKKNAV